jgi:F-type H+-transporting ATPase subunit delta
MLKHHYPYLIALRERFQLDGSEDRVFEDIHTLYQLFETVPSFRFFLESTGIAISKKIRFLKDTFKELPLHKNTLFLIEFLSEEDQISHLRFILNAFLQLKGVERDDSFVEVVVSREEDIEIIEQNKLKFEKQLGRKVHLHIQVDSSILGGVIVRYPNHTINVSYKEKIRQLKASLTQVVS